MCLEWWATKTALGRIGKPAFSPFSPFYLVIYPSFFLFSPLFFKTLYFTLFFVVVREREGVQYSERERLTSVYTSVYCGLHRERGFVYMTRVEVEYQVRT